MPFVRGAPKHPNSGRKKGIPTKIAAEIAIRQDAAAILLQTGCDPIAGMASIAMDRTVPVELRGRMLSELAQYLHPKLRATDHRLVDANGNDRSLLSEFDRLVEMADAAASLKEPLMLPAAAA